METTISQASPVEYELELTATADDIEPNLNEALKEQRKHMDVQGFRKGKVPLGLVKKMHGEQIGYKVAQEFVQEAFEEEVESNDEIDPLGQPTITELDYALDEDLRAMVRFGVRPEIEIQDASSEELTMLNSEVTDEDVEEEIQRLRTGEADLLPMEDEPAGEENFVNIDLQRIDPQTDTPIIGDKDEDLSFFLDDERLKEELREALLGKTAGDTFRVTLPQAPAQDQAPPHERERGEEEDRLYEVVVNDVKARDLPPLDEAFVSRLTDGQFEDPDAFRDEVRRQLEQQWEKQSREMVQAEIIDKMLELHPVPVPESVIETYLDSFVNQVKQENDGELPPDFDKEHFRNQNRRDAEKQGRWMLIRDKVVDNEDIEVDDEDLQDFFSKQAQGDDEVDAQQIKQFYRQMPQMMDRVKQQILSDKVYDLLIERFDVQEKTREEFEEEMQQHRQAQAQQQVMRP